MNITPKQSVGWWIPEDRLIDACLLVDDSHIAKYLAMALSQIFNNEIGDAVHNWVGNLTHWTGDQLFSNLKITLARRARVHVEVRR